MNGGDGNDNGVIDRVAVCLCQWSMMMVVGDGMIDLMMMGEKTV